MNENQDWQKKYTEFQQLQQQIEQVTQHLQILGQQSQELEISINAVNELKNIEINTEVLAPIANGIFLKANLVDNQKVIINVGSDVTVEKTVPDAVALLESEANKVRNKVVEIEMIMQELNNQAMKIFEEVQAAEQ